MSERTGPQLTAGSAANSDGAANALPDLAQLQKRLAQLPPEKRAAFEKLLRQRTASSQKAPARLAISPVPRDGDLVASYAQRRLWFLDRLEPGNPFYNLPSATRLRGAIDPRALAQALSALSQRHETLRSKFVEVEGEPQTRIEAASPIRLPVVDLTGLDDANNLGDAKDPGEAKATGETSSFADAAHATALHSLLQREARRSFQLHCAPLWRACLVRLAATDHVLLLTLHHSIADGWSQGLLLSELIALYRASAGGPPAELPPLGVQYVDYAAWQRQHLSGSVLDEQLAYWKQHLAGSSHLELPTDRPRPAVQTFRGGSLRERLPAEVTLALKQRAKSQDSSLFMLLLAAFQTVLWRHTGQSDGVIGTPVAGRSHQELQGLIGMFVNTLPLRLDAAGDPSFSQLLRSARELCLAAFSHQDLPFELLVEHLAPVRDLSRNPVFQVLLNLQSATAQKPTQMGGVLFEPLQPERGTTQLDLGLALGEDEDGLSLAWEFASDLFDRSTVQRLAGAFRRTLHCIAAGDDSRLSQLPLLEPGQRQQLLVEWNDTRRDLSLAGGCASVTEALARRAAQHPDRVALVFGQESMSYSGLWRAVQELSRRLQQGGLDREELVGIALERGPRLLLAALAVQEAGGAYLPLDPAYPQQRLAWMLEDSGARRLISEPDVLQRLGELVRGYSGEVLDVSEPPPELAEHSNTAGASSSPILGAQRAYVLYTSGSTGRPKGVEVSHRALGNFLATMAMRPGLGSGDRLLAVTSLSFDIAGLELYLPLVQGARLVMADAAQVADGELLLHEGRRQRVNMLQATPSTWQLLLAAGWDGEPELKSLVGGEAVSQQLAAALVDCSSSAWNVYGPTETTVWSTVDQLQSRTSTPVLVGRPVAHTHLLVVDRGGHVQLPCVPGELWIGGRGVARGYLGRPALSAERFVPDPLAGLAGLDAGGRAYRTGDLVRFRADGRVEFLGRLDHQVKLRGYRIELGEIESRLLAHAGVHQAVVQVRPLRSGEPALVAYLVPAEGSEVPATAELRAWLSEELPSYMVPTVYMPLESLPLTPNRKVDRKALPQPEPVESGAEAVEAPRGPREEVLAGIFAQVLGLDQVGREQGFFDLGGHSLLATQVVAQVRDTLGMELPVRSLFEHPTVAGLAVQLESQELGDLAAPPLRVEQRPARLPLSFSQERLWFLDRLEPGDPAHNLGRLVPLARAVDPSRLRACLAALILRHESLRTTFEEETSEEEAGQPHQVVWPFPQGQEPGSARFLPRLPLIDLQDLDDVGRSRALRAMQGRVGQHRFELSRGPLMWSALVRIRPDRHHLFILTHHIISDGWSLGLMERELGELYEASQQASSVTELALALPPLALQYADVALWQRRWLHGEAREQLRAYWREALAKAPALLRLPTDRPRPAVQSHAGRRLMFRWDRDLVSSLEAQVRSQGATLFMGLLAAWQGLLGRQAGQREVVVGTYVANRGRAGVEDLIGFFVNTLAMPTSVAGDPSFHRLLQRARAGALAAFAHQEMPFEAVIEAVQPTRSLSHTPLFQVMLVLQNATGAALGSGEGAAGNSGQTGNTQTEQDLTGQRARSTTAHFDLTLWLWPRDGGLEGSLDYATALYDESTVWRHLSHLQRLLRGALARPDAPLSSLQLLSAGEQHQILVEHNDSGAIPRSLRRAGLASVAETARVHEGIAQVANAQPDAVSLVHGPVHISYGQLQRSVYQLAASLVAAGVGDESLVPLVTRRCPEMVVGMLAVWQAGGAYVPLDPDSPTARLQSLLRELQPAVLLCQEALIAGLPWPDQQCLSLDGGTRPSTATPRQPSEEHGVEQQRCSPQQAAYVIYTSGSTGQPKGVVVPHAAIAAYASSAAHDYEVGTTDRALQLASITFDASAEEIFPTLLRGAALELRSEQMLDSAAVFMHQVGRRRLSILNLPTAFWHELTLAMESEEELRLPGSVRLVILGGEAVLGQRLAAWTRCVPASVELANTYGPTEATVVATRQALQHWRPGEPLSIGRPVRRATATVVDPLLRPVALGVPGQLALGGAGLARGYLLRPGLSAERFVPEEQPRNDGPGGGRLYLSGDLVRRLRGGELEYLGRTDHQVKVRGYRVELGEIENRLSSLAAVKEAVVQLWTPKAGDPRLVAYVVPGAAAEPVQAGPQVQESSASTEPMSSSTDELGLAELGLAELQRLLARDLPAYMLPSHLVLLEQMPLTTSGKVDRNALPAPSLEKESGGRAPQGELESKLAALFADVLGLEEVGAEQSFFQLGGHSLLATRLVSRVRRDLDRELPLAQLFETATVEALAQWLVAQPLEHSAQPGLRPVPRRAGTELALSFAQERLWFLHRMEPHSAAYNIPMAVPLPAELSVPLLCQTLSSLVRRHESLRTRFPDHGGVPRQEIALHLAGGVAWPVPHIDLRGLRDQDQQQLSQELAIAQARASFDLARGPLLRTRLLQRDGDWLLVLVMHHIISDGWSMGLLAQEVQTLYRSLAEGEGVTSPLPELPVQYADYAAWQRELLQSGEQERQLRYWQQQLQGARQVLELPTDRPRPALPRHRGAYRTLRIDAATSQALGRLAEAEQGTLFMALVACFALQLGRLAGQRELLLGTPVAGRNRTELEHLIGLFVNTLVLRVRSHPGGTFRQLLREVRQTALAAYAHQDLPFEKLVEELAPERDLARSPLFQAMLVLQNTRAERGPASELASNPLLPESGAAKLDLLVDLVETTNGMVGRIEYDRDLFDSSTAERLARHLGLWARAASTAPDRVLSELDALPRNERHQLLHEANDVPASQGSEQRVHRLVAAQALRIPEATALVWGEQRLSYGQVYRAARRLAAELRGRGIGPWTRVAVCLRRGPELLVSLLAVLETEGAYVAIDPAYPKERIGYLLEDSQAALVISTSELGAALQLPQDLLVQPGLMQLEQTEDREGADLASVLRPRSQTGPENNGDQASPLQHGEHPSHVIYTSGSTGQPKGVVIRHRSTAALLRWAQEAFSPRELGAVLASTSASFDLSVFEIFGTWAAGGTVILAENALQLGQLAARDEVRLVNTVPSALRELLAQGALPASVRTVALAGEALPRELVDEVYQQTSVQRVLNLYGPSEDTTYSTGARMPRRATGHCAIGTVLAGGRAYAADPELHLQPRGAFAELVLGGDGLALGYLERPSLTAERFVPDPFSGLPGERLYRTGDLVRVLADGQLAFHGRMDHQVKVRGFRIELGEIEARLTEHPAVAQAVAIVREDLVREDLVREDLVREDPAREDPVRDDPASDRPAQPGGPRVVAYLVSALPQREAATLMREHLEQFLPQYMVPSAFVVLDSLPLTPNGKLDRKALPKPQAETSQSHSAHASPLVELVAGVVADVLYLDQVGPDDDFFTLGGHSLLATQVISRLNMVLDVDLSLEDLFLGPRPSSLALLIEQRQAAGAGIDPAPPLTVASTQRSAQGGMPLSFAQERLWLIDRLEPGNNSYNLPAGLRLRGELHTAALRAALAAMVKRHESLRTRFPAQTGEPRQVVDEFSGVQLPQVDLRGLEEDTAQAESRRVARASARQPFDLGDGPLLRVLLLQVRAQEQVLIFAMHHIISDGWSMGLALGELERLYAAFSRAEPSPLTDLPVQYADFAVWQRDWLEGGELERQLGFWRQALDEAPQVLEMPTDRPRPPVQSSRGAGWPLQLTSELAQAVRAFSREESATPFMVLLAAFGALLGRWTQQDLLLLGSPIAGRNRPEVEGLIGFFVNTLAYRVDLRGQPSFRILVERVRAHALAAYAHQDLPFERLVGELVSERDLSRAPLLQVVLALQSAAPRDQHGSAESPQWWPGLDAQPLTLDTQSSKFDLTLELEDGGASGADADGASATISGHLQYARDIYDQSTVRRLLGQLVQLLRRALEDPDQSVVSLDLLDPAERQQVAVELPWGGAPARGLALGHAAPVLDQVRQQVLARPEGVAVVAEGSHLSYGELGQRARAWAAELRRVLAGRDPIRAEDPDTVVAVLLPRGPELVQAYLTCLEAGVAYLPLDPALPAERLRYQLQDSGAAAVLRDSALEGSLVAILAELGLPDLRLDRQGASDLVEHASLQPVSIQAQPRTDAPDLHLAYVIYTSGSTGRPKGVALSHRGLTQLCHWMRGDQNLQDEARSTQLAGLGFDATVGEVWPSLTAGATICMPDEESRSVPQRLLRWLQRERISHCFLPTPVAEEALQLEWPRDVALRCLGTGGDRLRRQPKAGLPFELVNMYGPTENTMVATGGRVAAQGPEVGTLPRALLGMPSIGRPMQGVSTWVVSPSGTLASRGMPGELLIGGNSLARGYLGKPGLTAASFVPDPHSGNRGERLYRSGDKVRWLANGHIDFMGRIDHQVQLRGYRIELGEIEGLLEEHVEVQQAVVSLVTAPSGESQLLAAVVPTAGETSQGERQEHASHRASSDTSPGSTAETDLGTQPALAADWSQQLRGYLEKHLPAYMVPPRMLVLDKIPLTPNGKVDRASLQAKAQAELSAAAVRAAEHQQSEQGQASAPASFAVGQMERRIAEIWREVLGLEAVSHRASFFDLGGHSLLLAKVQGLLEQRLERDVPMVELFRHPTVHDLASFLVGQGLAAESPALAIETLPEQGTALPASGHIAVVGLAGRYPGAQTIEAFWQLLCSGTEAVQFFDDEELLAAGVARERLDDPDFVKAALFLEDSDQFDASLFGISPREAERLDPQQRVFLECAWAALERASLDPQQFSGRVGVYAGAGTNRYWLSLISAAQGGQADPMQLVLGNEKDFVATRLSYKLDLRGPAVTVQTACSTSLVATHFACKALLSGECDAALAGGVSLAAYGPSGYAAPENGILSPDGHTRAFDARGKGTVAGSGCGVVVLRRLEDALADGDTIHAVIRGTSINNDGAGKVGFTAPSVEGQARAIREAQQLAEVSPATVDYVEAHGTATPLGDSIEVAALRQAFGDQGSDRVLLGSVKTNIGHLDAAAGVTGLIKAVLAVEEAQLPASLGFEQANPQIDFGSFQVVTEQQPWPQRDGPRRAGVSSFGLGGTNAHAVLEQSPEREDSGPSRDFQLILLSAQHDEALDQLQADFARHLQSHARLDLADVAHSLRLGRRRLQRRRAWVVRDREELLQQWQQDEGALQRREEQGQRPIAFLLSGVGDQYPQMGRGLYESEPAFREVMNRGNELLRQEYDLDLLGLLYAGEGPEGGEEDGQRGSRASVNLKLLLGRGQVSDGSSQEGTDQGSRRQREPLARTRVAQPAVFLVQVALAKLLAEWGVRPGALLGYSLGELSAAHLAGVFSFEDALRLVVERARAIDSLPVGGMTAVPLPAAELGGVLPPGVWVAAHNGPAVTVVSGQLPALAQLEQELNARGMVFQRLATGQPFHTPLLQAAGEQLEQRMARMELQEPSVPLLSNLSGTWMQAGQATDPAYWRQHLTHTVRFTEGLGELLQGEGWALMELGPGQALATAARQHPDTGAEHVVLASLRDQRENANDQAFLLRSLAQLWLAGTALDWSGFAKHETRRKLPLPTYPFQRQRYWVGNEASPTAEGAPSRQGLAPVLQGPSSESRAGLRPQDLGSWCQVRTWVPAVPAKAMAAEGRWLLIEPRSASEEVAHRVAAMAAELQLRGADLILVRESAEWQHEPDSRQYALPYDSEQAWDQLFQLVKPARLVHLGWLGAPQGEAEELEARTEGPEREFFDPGQLGHLLAFGRALSRMTQAARLSVVGCRFCDAPGTWPSRPRAAVGAWLRGLEREIANLRVSLLDVDPAPTGPLDQQAKLLAGELCAEQLEPVLRLYGRWRYRQEVQRLPLPALASEAQGSQAQTSPPQVPDRTGPVVLTGDLGRLGRALVPELTRPGQPLAILGLDRHGQRSDPEQPTLESWVEERRAQQKPVHWWPVELRQGPELRAAWEELEQRYGRPSQVVYAVDTTETVFLQDLDPGMVESLLEQQCRPAQELDCFLGSMRGETGDQPVPLLLCSSLVGSIGVAGQMVPSMAAAFLDALAVQGAAQGRPLQSAAWDGWSWVQPGGIIAEQGGEVCRRFLASGLPHALLSPLDLAEALRQRSETRSSRTEKVATLATSAGASGSAKRHRRPELATPYVQPTTGDETALAEIWRDLLGVDRVGIEDNFLELGGDSLLGLQVLARVKEQLGVVLEPAHLFEAPTVASLAALVAKHASPPSDEAADGDALDELEGLIADLDAMSLDEVEAALETETDDTDETEL